MTEEPDGSEKSDVLPEVYACLWVGGSFDPAALTELLGVRPKKAQRVGDQIFRGRSRAKIDMWHFSTERESTLDLPGHVERILALIRPHADQLNAFRHEHDVRVVVHLVVWMDEQAPIGLLPTEMLNEVASLGADLDLDLYNLSEPHRAHE